MLSTTTRARPWGASNRSRSRRGWAFPFLGFVGVAVPVELVVARLTREIISMPSFDKDWCIENRLVPSATIVLADRTDPFSDRHRAALGQIVDPLAAMQRPNCRSEVGSPS